MTVTEDQTTWTYVGPSDLGVFADPIHEVRFLIKDTVQTAFSLTDQEVMWFLRRGATTGPAGPVYDTRTAAAAAAEDRAALFAAQAKTNVDVGPFRVQKDYSQAAAEMRLLAAAIRTSIATDDVAVPFVTPLSDSVVPVFQVGMTDPRFLAAQQWQAAWTPTVI